MLSKGRVDVRSGTAFISRDVTFEAVTSFTPPIEFYGRKIEFKADAVFQHLAWFNTAGDDEATTIFTTTYGSKVSPISKARFASMGL
jgi:hypothetical protein